MTEKTAEPQKKLVFITGGSRGIGKACALEFARNGYDLVLTARDRKLLAEVAEESQSFGIRAEGIPIASWRRSSSST